MHQIPRLDSSRQPKQETPWALNSSPQVRQFPPRLMVFYLMHFTPRNSRDQPETKEIGPSGLRIATTWKHDRQIEAKHAEGVQIETPAFEELDLGTGDEEVQTQSPLEHHLENI